MDQEQLAAAARTAADPYRRKAQGCAGNLLNTVSDDGNDRTCEKRVLILSDVKSKVSSHFIQDGLEFLVFWLVSLPNFCLGPKLCDRHHWRLKFDLGPLEHVAFRYSHCQTINDVGQE